MVVVVTPNPCVDKTLFIKENHWGEKSRFKRCKSGGRKKVLMYLEFCAKTWGRGGKTSFIFRRLYRE